MTLAVFSRFGTIPDEKERMNRYNRGSEISSLMALTNFGVILSGAGVWYGILEFSRGFLILKFTNNFVYLIFTYRKSIHTIFKWWRQIIFKVISYSD